MGELIMRLSKKNYFTTILMLPLFIMALASNFSYASNSSGNVFSDVPEEHWAFDAINSLFDAGIIKGYPQGNAFKGEKPLSRNEFAVAIKHLLENIDTPYENIKPEDKGKIKMLVRYFRDDLKKVNLKIDDIEKDFSKLLFVVNENRNEIKKINKKIAALEKKDGRQNIRSDSENIENKWAQTFRNRGFILSMNRPEYEVNGVTFDDNSVKGGFFFKQDNYSMEFMYSDFSASGVINDTSMATAVTGLSAGLNINGGYSFSNTEMDIKSYGLRVSKDMSAKYAANKAITPYIGAGILRNDLNISFTPIDSQGAEICHINGENHYFSGQLFAGVNAQLTPSFSLGLEGVYDFGSADLDDSWTSVTARDGAVTPAVDSAKVKNAVNSWNPSVEMDNFSVNVCTKLKF